MRDMRAEIRALNSRLQAVEQRLNTTISKEQIGVIYQAVQR